MCLCWQEAAEHSAAAWWSWPAAHQANSRQWDAWWDAMPAETMVDESMMLTPCKPASMEVDSHEAMDEPPFSLTARVMNTLLRQNTGDELEGITNTNNKQNKHNKTKQTTKKTNTTNKLNNTN
jgi:hypothetical protein